VVRITSVPPSVTNVGFLDVAKPVFRLCALREASYGAASLVISAEPTELVLLGDHVNVVVAWVRILANSQVVLAAKAVVRYTRECAAVLRDVQVDFSVPLAIRMAQFVSHLLPARRFFVGSSFILQLISFICSGSTSRPIRLE